MVDGTLELKGDFEDLSDVQDEYSRCFYTDPEHTSILSADVPQRILGSTKEGMNYNGVFGRLEIKNTSKEGVRFDNCPYIYNSIITNQSITAGEIRINPETTISGNEICGLYIKDRYGYSVPDNLQVINGDMRSDGDIYINSDLLVKGNVTSPYTYVGQSSLSIIGDIDCDSVSIDQEAKVSVNNCDLGYLSMPYKDSYLLVNGNYSNSYSLCDRYENGTIEIKKNLYLNPEVSQKTEIGTYILSGDTKQCVSAGTMEQSNYYFKELHFQNTSEEGVVLESVIHAQNCSMNDTIIKYNNDSDESGRAGWTLEEDETVNEDLILSGGVLNLNGKTLTVRGNLIQEGGQVILNGGTLVVDKDYRVQNQCISGNDTMYQASFGSLIMNQETDHIIVKSNFIFDSGLSTKVCKLFITSPF